MTDTSPHSLHVKFSACTGCKACTIACVLVHEQYLDLHHARIRIHKNFPGLERPVFKPRFCRMCKNARCVDVCPTNAIYEILQKGEVILDRALCNGCGLCVDACPFDAIWIDDHSGLALKCDLCDGDPACVKFCSPHALEFS